MSNPANTTRTHFLKRALIGTTALVSAVMITPAQATDITISTPTSTTQTLGTGDNLTITNTGSITISGVANAVEVRGIAANTITNDGTLSSSILSSLVVAGSADVTGGINNSGVIKHGMTIGNTSDVSGGIDNSGTILRTVRLNNYGDISGGFTNTGNLLGSSSDELIINGHSNISGGFHNAGLLTGVSIGVTVNNSSNISGGLDNSGTISGLAEFGIIVGGNSDISGGINNTGKIAGRNAIVVGGSGGVISGGITNTGIIEGTSGTAIHLANGRTAATPINLNGGQVIGKITDDQYNSGSDYSPLTVGGNIATQGDISVSSVTVSAGDTLEVSSGNTLATPKLRFGLDNGSQSGKLVIDNGALDLTSTNIQALVGSGATLFNGEQMLIVDGTAAIIGGPGGTLTAIVDNSAAWDFQIADGTAAASPTDNTDLFLFVTATGAHDITISAPTAVTQNLGAADRLTVTNTGSIAVTGVANAINVQGVAAGAITNNGTISSSILSSIVVHSGADVTGGITNTGVIKRGITIGNTSDVSGGIANSGTVFKTVRLNNHGDVSGGFVNSGKMLGLTQDALIVSGSSDISGGLTNSGTITGASIGVTVNINSNISGGIHNTGTISGAGIRGIVVGNSSDISGGINNSGTIQGPSGILVGSNSAVSGGITNTGTIDGFSGTAIHLQSGRTTATPINLNGGQVIGDIIDDQFSGGSDYSPLTVGGNAGVQGYVNVSSATLNAGSTLTISGSGATLNTPALKIGLDNNQAGLLVVSNGAVDLSSTSLEAIVGANAGLFDGEQILIADGSAPIIGGPGGTLAAITDNSSMWDFQIADGTAASSPTDDTDLFLFVTLAGGGGGGPNITISAPTTAPHYMAAGENLTVTNTGSIVAPGFAVLAFGSPVGSIVNDGLISGSSEAIRVGYTNVTGGITNTGAIHGNYAGIDVGSSGDISGGITNSGSIAASTGIRVSGFNTRISGGIHNSGTISGVNAAIRSQYSGDISGGITNAGRIAAASAAIRVEGAGADISGGIDNSGVITGAYGVRVSDNSRISGGITNEAGGTIEGTGGIAILLGDFGGSDLSGPTPITINGGRIIGAIVDANFEPGGSENSPTIIAGNFKTEGTIAVSSVGVTNASKLTISGGNEVIAGSMTPSSGTLSFGIDNSGSTGFLEISQGAVDLSGLTVEVSVDSGATLTAGQEIEIADGAFSIIGGPGGTLTTVVDNSPLWDFKIANGTAASSPTDDSDLFLFVVAAPPPPPPQHIVIRTATSAPITLNSGDTLKVTPSGSINVTETAPGITVNGVAAGSITNRGTITNRIFDSIDVVNGGDITGGINNKGTLGHGIGIGSSDVSGGIINTGLIENVVRLNGNSDVSGGINNKGSMLGITQDDLIVSFHSNISGGLTNTGTITGFSNAITVKTSSDISGGILNKGTITGDAQYAVAVGNHSDISGGIENRGSVTGYEGIHVTDHSMISGGIHNYGTIEGTGGTAISLANLTGSTPIDIESSSAIIGDVVDDTPSSGFSPVFVNANFGTQGNFNVSSLSIASGKALTIGSDNTVTLDHMPSSSGGKLSFGVDSTTDFGKLVVTNGALDLTGLTIKAFVGAGETLANGEQLMIGDGAAPIIGGPGGTKTNITDNSALWKFQIADGTAASSSTDNTDLFLFVTQQGGGTHANALAALQSVTPQGGSVLQNAMNNINMAPTDQQLNQLIASVMPSVNEMPQFAAQDFSDRVLSLADDRISSFTDDAGAGPLLGYSENTPGLTAMGVATTKIAPGTLVGLDVSSGQTASNAADPNATNTGLANYQVTLYGNRFLSGDRYLRGMAAYASSNTSTARHDIGGQGGPTAQASFGADEYLSRIEAGRSFDCGRAKVTPNLLMNWMHYNPENYREAGAGDADLAVQQKGFDSLELGLGVKTSWTYDALNGARFVPDVRAGYRYDVIGDRMQATSRLAGGGDTYTSEGSSGRNCVSFGAGVTYSLPSNWDFRAGYDVDMRSGYTSQVGSLKAALKF